MDSLRNSSTIENLARFAISNSFVIKGKKNQDLSSLNATSEIGYDVSILIATYNHSEYIAEAVESAIRQEAEDLKVQIMVGDDGSPSKMQRSILADLSLRFPYVIFLGSSINMANKCEALVFPVTWLIS